MLENEKLTAKNMPDSFNMRATQICIVPIYLRIHQNKRRDIIYVTYLYPSKIVTSSMILVRDILFALRNY